MCVQQKEKYSWQITMKESRDNETTTDGENTWILNPQVFSLCGEVRHFKTESQKQVGAQDHEVNVKKTASLVLLLPGSGCVHCILNNDKNLEQTGCNSV